MLVIARKKGESVLIGDNIEVTVIRVEDGSVKLAINAPKDISILRKELYKEIGEENKTSTEFDVKILKTLKK